MSPLQGLLKQRFVEWLFEGWYVPTASKSDCSELKCQCQLFKTTKNGQERTGQQVQETSEQYVLPTCQVWNSGPEVRPTREMSPPQPNCTQVGKISKTDRQARSHLNNEIQTYNTLYEDQILYKPPTDYIQATACSTQKWAVNRKQLVRPCSSSHLTSSEVNLP